MYDLQMGDTRKRKPFYTGIPVEVMQRIGKTMLEGLTNYDPSIWDRFYQKNFQPEDYLMSFDHAIEHTYKAYDEIVRGKIHDGGEDHLSHAASNLIMIIWATENGMLPNKLQSIPELQRSNEEDIEVPSQTPVIVENTAPTNESLLKFFGIKKG